MVSGPRLHIQPRGPKQRNLPPRVSVDTAPGFDVRATLIAPTIHNNVIRWTPSGLA